jgi:hypothetical protein
MVTLLIAVVGEPLVMYLTLVREKEQRRAAAELTLETTSARNSSPGAAAR